MPIWEIKCNDNRKNGKADYVVCDTNDFRIDILMGKDGSDQKREREGLS